MAIYTINYHTGVGNQDIETDDLQDVMSAADNGAAYTQQPISIEDNDGNLIARRAWCGVPYDGEGDDPIEFGDFGHYADWYMV